MHARSTTVTARLDAIDAGIAHIRGEVMPALMDVTGCVGLSLIVDRQSGRCIATSAWDNEQDMRASDSAVQSIRTGAAEAFGGSIDKVEEWEIAVLHREHKAGDGALVRCVWLEGQPDGMDRAIEVYNARILPEIESLVGFRSASLFVNRATGRAVGASAWSNRETFEHAKTRLDALRETAAPEAGARVLEVAEFELAIAELRVPEMA